MRNLITFTVVFVLCFLNIDAQSLIQSGPMVGYSSMREAGIWIQTTQSADVAIRFWKQDSSDFKKVTQTLTTNMDNHYVAHITAHPLEPGHTYQYEVIIDGKIMSIPYPLQFKSQPLWQWRHDAPNFSFVAGSCVYVSDSMYDRPGEPYGGDYHIFNTIDQDNPDFMVWLGDNTYLREADWDSKFGIYYRHKHTRSLKNLQPLLGRTHHYAIWDDHDYGPNDSDRSFVLKNTTLQAFKDFWFNPVYHAGESKGITGQFTWHDCDFFLLDNRWYRTPHDSSGQIIGDEQLTWLKEALINSKASFKFICIGGQFISDLKAFENHAQYPEERQQILSMLNDIQVKNVVFLN